MSINTAHPRIFITEKNRDAIKAKAFGPLAPVWYQVAVKNQRHDLIPGRTSYLRDYILKYGYIYQMTGDEKWAGYVLQAMAKFPASLVTYGKKPTGYGYALEGLSYGFDLCHDVVAASGKEAFFIDLMEQYWLGNQGNLEGLPDFHNYSAHAMVAMTMAGLALHELHPEWLTLARDYMEHGVTRDEVPPGIRLNMLEAVTLNGGACNWEGVTYGRHQLFNIIKYCESIKSATDGADDPWTRFGMVREAGYHIIYSLQSDDNFANIGDVTYRQVIYNDLANMAGLQGAFKDGHFTKFLNDRYVFSGPDTRGRILYKGPRQGYAGSAWIPYLLWFDPDITPESEGSLPKVRAFDDVTIIRDGWGYDDTMVTFKAGKHWGFHSQLDHGSFTIFKGVPLAIDSGYAYGWSGWRSQHTYDYYHHAIAHNTLIVRNPDEVDVEWPKYHHFGNDGGQRLAWVTGSPPHPAPGYSNKPWSASDMLARLDEFGMAKILLHKTENDHVAIIADLTNAYTNIYSGQGSNRSAKAAKVVRYFVYFFGGPVVIYDIVEALDPTFRKAWLLHSGAYATKAGCPRLGGNNSIESGILELEDVNDISIDNGGRSLFVQCVLPEKRVVRRIGGAGYEFWADGKNYGIQEGARLRAGEDPGAWRVEVCPVGERLVDEFLHILYPWRDGACYQPPKLSRNDGLPILYIPSVNKTIIFSSDNVEIIEEDKC